MSLPGTIWRGQPDPPHIYTDGSIWVTSSSVQEDMYQEIPNTQGQFVTPALSGDFQLGKEFVKRG